MLAVITILLFIFVLVGPALGYQRYSGQRSRLGPGRGYTVNPLITPQPSYPQQLAAVQPEQMSASAFQTSYRALWEDITTFGNELRDLDLEVVGLELSSEANQDYTRALDAYDGAKNQLDRAQGPEDLKRVAQILEEGRFSIACVISRVSGKPLPQRRPPCFFDPAHGPSVEDIFWAPMGGVPRKVPACRADADRVRLGTDPSIRMVPYAGQMQPYWENQEYAPYAQGYYSRYGLDPTVRNLANSALMIGGLSLLFGLFDE